MERRSPENRKKPRFKRKGKGPDRRVQDVPVENNRRVGARRHCEAEPPQSVTEWTTGLILWCHRSWKSEWKENLIGTANFLSRPQNQSGCLWSQDWKQTFGNPPSMDFSVTTGISTRWRWREISQQRCRPMAITKSYIISLAWYYMWMLTTGSKRGLNSRMVPSTLA